MYDEPVVPIGLLKVEPAKRNVLIVPMKQDTDRWSVHFPAEGRHD